MDENLDLLEPVQAEKLPANLPPEVNKKFDSYANLIFAEHNFDRLDYLSSRLGECKIY